MSAGQSYTAREYLPLFAERGKKNVHGWGIGFFREESVHVEASHHSAYGPEGIHQSFQRLARVIDSRVIVSNLNCPLGVGEGPHTPLNTPLSLHFLEHNWLFVHYGVMKNMEDYDTRGEPVDSPMAQARVFEFLRDRLVEKLEQDPYSSLFEQLRLATREMIDLHPGNCVYFLTNGSVLFAFFNHHQLMLLKERESLGDVILITTLEEGIISTRDWKYKRLEGDQRGRFLIISGSELIYDVYIDDG
jgi:predicted glutamine amidotransferase